MLREQIHTLAELIVDLASDTLSRQPGTEHSERRPGRPEVN